MLNTGVVDGDNKPQEQATNAVRDSELKLRGSKKKKHIYASISSFQEACWQT